MCAAWGSPPASNWCGTAARRSRRRRETTRLLNLLRDEGVLIGGEGKLGNVLKIRPPIVFTREHADFAVAALDRALAQALARGCRRWHVLG